MTCSVEGTVSILFTCSLFAACLPPIDEVSDPVEDGGGPGGAGGAGPGGSAGRSMANGGVTAIGSGGAFPRGGSGGSSKATGGVSNGGSADMSDGGASAGGGGRDGSGGAADGGESPMGDGGSAGDPFSTNREDFFGESRCNDLDVLFCDGFEEAAIDTDSWEKRGPGTASIDSTQAARGDGSLHVFAEGNGFSYLSLTRIFPVADNRYYGRLFVRFDSMPTAPDWAHWTIAEGQGTGDGSLIRVGGQWDQDINRFGVGTDGGPTGDWTNLDQDPSGSPKEVPIHEWLCIEWLHDGAADETKFWWDAVEHPSLATTADSHGGNDVPYVMPEFQAVWIGWWLYQADPVPDHFDVWIDEVAFDTARIGCVR